MLISLLEELAVRIGPEPHTPNQLYVLVQIRATIKILTSENMSVEEKLDIIPDCLREICVYVDSELFQAVCDEFDSMVGRAPI
jgi:hypothetical protein